jgi:TonB family protein
LPPLRNPSVEPKFPIAGREAEPLDRVSTRATPPDDVEKSPESLRAATTPDDEDIEAFKVGPSVSAPQVLVKVDPQYTEEARAARLAGRLLLSIVVGTDGGAEGIRVVEGLGMGLDERAVDSVALWRFQPGKKDGKPVRVRGQVEVNFRFF